MTWNPNIPAVGNQVSADIPDILENLAHLAFWQIKRSKFTYNGGATAYTVKVGAGAYHVKDKIAYWVSELTTGAIGTPAAWTRYYLYLDYSAITSGTLITASELIWSDTAPTYSHALGGYYNGDDLCIFGGLTNGTPDNIFTFYHDGGDFVLYDESILGGQAAVDDFDFDDIDVDDSAVDIYLPIPAFATKAQVIIHSKYVDGVSVIYAQPKGGTYWHTVGSVAAGVTESVCGVTFFTDSSQVMSIAHSVSNGNTSTVRVGGWYFPAGM